ncbi:MAG: 4-hydroxy-tetrahydrodipicolinate reductase, partial [Candidatus Vogelbacteria bacterium]|nr:4-hydroxy-tetrahydrodipicolinate reductase [Candidatus Vogelbacteria bacterium]
MRIALIGYGKMGKEVERVAKLRGIEIAAIIDPKAEKKEGQYKVITEDALRNADVAIDFTMPSAAIENIRKVSALGKNMVVATTGWHDKLDEARHIVGSTGIGLIYSSNFSVGVNVYFRIIEEAAKLFNKVDAYDAYGYEAHHNQKVDSPSGTAKTAAEILLRNIERKKKAVYDKFDRKIEPDELHFASIRAGSIPGTHAVGFDSEA